MKIIEQIAQTKSELQRTKPRSRRRTVLEHRLRDLMARQLRKETQEQKRAA